VIGDPAVTVTKECLTSQRRREAINWTWTSARLGRKV